MTYVHIKPWIAGSKHRPRVMSCKDCGWAPDAPMIVRDVWDDQACKPDEDPRRLLLCIRCVELRLGRPLCAVDLVPSPMNGAALYLMSRYGDVVPRETVPTALDGGVGLAQLAEAIYTETKYPSGQARMSPATAVRMAEKLLRKLASRP